ncbi:MAG: hypothetical protein D6683_02645 [Actinomyces sp.]|nr:MAG: hypothetical protein D6683_02645 [Actinomyces sp.]
MRELVTVVRRLAARVDNGALAAAPRPHDPAGYERPVLDGSGPRASEIPLDGTRPGASRAVWVPRTLDGCREPLVPGAPDLRGVWEVVEGRMKGHVERIEQAGNRITISVGGLVHDMYCDGTLENGVERRLHGPPLDHPATRAAAEAAGMLPD